MFHSIHCVVSHSLYPCHLPKADESLCSTASGTSSPLRSPSKSGLATTNTRSTAWTTSASSWCATVTSRSKPRMIWSFSRSIMAIRVAIAMQLWIGQSRIIGRAIGSIWSMSLGFNRWRARRKEAGTAGSYIGHTFIDVRLSLSD